jgi:outer membrane protein assembly factor BamB
MRCGLIFPLIVACGREGIGNTELLSEEPEVQFRVDSQPGQPEVAGGVVYLGSEAGTLFAVDMQSARVLWRFEGGGPILHAPILAGDLLLFGSQDGHLRAVDKSNGELQWEFEAGDVDWDVRDVFINGIPTVKDGIAYFSSEDFNVYAVEVATGREVWRHTLGEEPQARLIPIVDRTAYIGAWDGHLYAIDIDTGERVWRSVTDDSNRASLPSQVPFVTVVPIVTDEAVYFTDWAGNLFAVDRETGRQVWRFDPGASDSRHVGSRSFMARDGDVLYYSTLEDQHLYGVDRRTGRKVWSMATDGIVYGPASAGNGIGLYAEFLPNKSEMGGTMLLRAMELSERRVLWTAEDMASAPTVVDSVVYYAGNDGTVHGRDLLTGKKLFRLGE